MNQGLNLFMTEEEFVPFGAEIHVSNFERSLEFYRDVLGFKLLRVDREWPFASFSFHTSIFMIDGRGDYPPPLGQGAILRFLIPGKLEEYYNQVKERGAVISKSIEKLSYGLTRFYVTDPDGYQLKFAVKAR